MVTDDVSRMIRGLFPRGRKPRSDRASIGALADALTEADSPIGSLLTHAVHTLSDGEWVWDRETPNWLPVTIFPSLRDRDGGQIGIRLQSRVRGGPLNVVRVSIVYSDRVRSRAICLAIPLDIDVRCEPEHISPGDHFDDRGDVEWIREQLDAGNEWAWCHVVVTVRVGDREGSDSLSGCAYKSESEFRQPGGYFSDMVRTAFGRAMGFDG